jgi:hypothetical protein
LEFCIPHCIPRDFFGSKTSEAELKLEIKNSLLLAFANTSERQKTIENIERN